MYTSSIGFLVWTKHDEITHDQTRNSSDLFATNKQEEKYLKFHRKITKKTI